MEKPRKKFLKIPHLDGGRELLKVFISENLVYPPKALEAAVEGDVIIKYRVTGQGEVIDPHIVKGIGYGCDEEALRLVGMLRYQAVKNRGVRVTASNRIKIPFRLPKVDKKPSVKLTYSPSKKPDAASAAKPEAAKGITYNYSIKYKS